MVWQKGQSGNPRGSAPVRRWKQAIEREINRRGIDYTGLQNAAKALVDAAEKGDIAALKELGDRIDGKSTQQINMDVSVEQRPVLELTAIMPVIDILPPDSGLLPKQES